ncbi:hypothetical protein GCM10023187_42360 [Nibrella viscosa]|uniref:Lipoprotein n=1 Tax=Nibrella viscosa TaxID=1084524 RepID=A0ABP8KSQ9_9BACT
MKALLYVLLLSSFCFSAQRPPKVDGLGKFRPGITTVGVIDDLARELNVQVVEQKKYLKESDFEKGKIYKVLYDPNEEKKPNRASKCTQSEVYRLGDYTFSGVELKDAYLTFYKKVLVAIECKIPADILEAMPNRYGTPESKKEEREIECSNGGNRSRENFYIYTWRDGDIEAESVIVPYYDNDCKRDFVRTFTVKAAKEHSAYIDCGK